MGTDVTEGAGPGLVSLEAPVSRDRGVIVVILEEMAVEEANLAEATVVDEAFRLRDHGPGAIGEVDEMDGAGCDRSPGHACGALDGRRQRLFAQDVLAGCEGGLCNCLVRGVRRRDVDDIDARIVDDAAPVDLGTVEAPARGRMVGGCAVGIHNDGLFECDAGFG